jgi:hypothetical protein
MELLTNDEEKKNNLIIYHQNMRSRNNNNEELCTMFLEKYLSSHFMYVSEHHMKEYEINNFQCLYTI